MSALPELPDASHALFEAWCTRTGHDYCFDRNANGDYVWADCFGAFDAWQASRKKALEDVTAELDGMTCNNATARSAIKLCIETIKEMKWKC